MGGGECRCEECVERSECVGRSRECEGCVERCTCGDMKGVCGGCVWRTTVPHPPDKYSSLVEVHPMFDLLFERAAEQSQQLTHGETVLTTHPHTHVLKWDNLWWAVEEEE